MATKNYDNFDFDDYQRKLRSGQNSNTGNGSSYDSFDFDDYYIRQNFTQIGASLTSSINNWLKNNESFFTNYNSRLGRYEGKDYLDWSYESDSGDWLSSLATQKTNLENEAKEIRTWLDQYKDYLDPEYYNSVAKALKGNTNEYEGIISRATEINKHWSTWETEDAYNEWVAGQRDLNEKLNFDLGTGKVELDGINKDFETFKNLSLQLTNLETEYARAGVENARELAESDLPDVVAQINAITSKYGVDAKGLASFVSEKNQYYTLAERVQNAKELASVADPTSKNYDPAFATKSQYQSTAYGDDASFWDKLANNAYGMGYEDITHEYINGDKELRSTINNKVKMWTFGNNAGGKSTTRFERAGYDYMSEDEIAIYNYYYNTEGKEKAQEYLDSLTESLQYQRGEGIAKQYEGNIAAQYIFAIDAGLDQFATGVSSIFSDEYKPTNATQIASGLIREDLGDDGFKIFGSSIGQIGYDIINTTSNMLPSILTSALVEAALPTVGEGIGVFVSTQAAREAGKLAGTAVLGMSAGGNGKAEMLQLGYSKEQANAYGLMVGAAEAGMEYLLGGITKLGGKLPEGATSAILNKVDNALARTAIKLGGNMLSEGFEEGIQTVIEPWLKEIATSVDWDDPTVDEVLYSSLLGALSAFVLEGGTTVAGEVNTYRQGQKVRKTDGGVGKLQSLATNTNYFSADTVAYKMASKVDAFTDAYTIGRLINEVGGTISEQNLTDITNGLIEKGIRPSDAKKLAKQYQAFLNGEMAMSDEQVKILENLSPLADVLRKNIIGANTTVYQRTRAYADIMSLADEVANGKKSKATTTEKPTDTAKSTMNIFDQQAVDDELKKVAFDVASGSRGSMAGRVLKESVNSASEAAAEKLGVEGKYTSSDTGATRLASNKKKVNVVGVDSIEDGVMKVKLNDGSVVDANEIDFSSSDEALVYEAVTNMGVSPTTAWEILKAYNPKSGQSGTIYAMGALEAYTYGHNGVKVDGMSKKGFADLLSPVQKNTANRLGDIDARAKVEAQQKNIDKAVKSVRDEAKSKHKAIPKRKGETVFEGDRARLTELQEKQLGVLEKVASGLGVTFHIFESKVDAEGKRYYTMPDGKITGANGWYDSKTGEIWIDLHAGNDGQGTMIFTAAHELTHFIRQWSPAKFKVFADFLFEQYGKKGQDVNQLVRDQIKKAADNGRSISWDEAYEEVIADSCETFLRDSKAAEKISALREKDAGLANKIKSFLGQMLAKMRKLMADLGLAPETKEGKMVAEMTDSLQKLYDLWTDALADAGTAYSTVGGEVDLDGNSNSHILSDRTMVEGAGLQFIPDEDGVHYQVLDADGNTVEKVTPEMIANSPLGQLVSSAKDNGFLGKGRDAEIASNKQYKFLAELVNMCIKYDGLAPVWEVAGTMVFSSIKSNADKQYGLTIDFSTVCKKTQAIVDAMSEAMVRLGRGLTRSEVETIYLEVGKAGESTPCPVCYVFSRWMGIGGILDQMSRFQDKYTNMSERDLQAFIADIKRRITERANTPNKNGVLKSEFFDKNGNIKEGQVIADLKQKANSGAGSTLNAITKNSNTQLEIQELKALMENQDAKEAKKTATKIKKKEATLVDVSALEKQFKAYNDIVEEYEAYQWLTRTLMEEVDGKWVKNKQFKPVPKDVLFDLNKGATFAEDYPLSWAFRTGKGASAGKAITPYADARVGEAIQGIASQDVKSINTGLDLNPFLNGDEETRKAIITKAIEKQARQNLIGGQRYQSTSDFRYEYGSDYLITFLEMQAIGAKVQLYTKVIEAVDFLASMGADINLSVMPLSDGYITLPDGTKKLIYSSVTGIDAEAAIKKSHEYNNVQLILVGISDEHIRLALEGEDVTFVIPFHGSGNTVHQIQVLMNLLGENLDVTTAQDYTAVQSDHVSPKQTKDQKAAWDLRVKILTGKASTLSAKEFDILNKNAYLKDLYERFYVNENAEEFDITLTSDVAKQIFPFEYWDKSLTYAEADKNGERFKEYCASMGIIPRFSGMNSKGESVGFGDFTNNKGYWKLLIDRPMYDNTYDADGNWTGYGKYHEQKRINCSDFQVKHLDPEYGSATYGDVMSKANDPKKTNMIVDRAIAQFENAKLSDRDSRIADTQAKITARYKRTVDKVLEGTYGSKDNVLMGYTPEIFRKLGMPSLPFVIGPGHIYSIAVTEAEAKADPLKRYNKNTNYHGLGADRTKKLLTAVQDPVMIIAAKDTDKKNTAPRSLHSVVAIIDVGNAREKLLMPVEITAERVVDGFTINVNTLSSSYMANVEGLVREAIAQTNIGDIGVYYMKKEATNLLSSRVQFPKSLTDKAASSNGIIHQFSEKINMQIDDVTKSLQFTNWFGDWQNKPEKASKVVNDDGTPMVVYHGSKSGNIKTFRTTNENGTGGLYLSTNRKVAEAFAGEDGEVYENYVNLRKPLIVDADGAYYDSIAVPAEMVGSRYTFGSNTVDTNAIAAYAREAGYDGVIVKNVRESAGFGDDIIAFKSNQVKSVDNVGTFDGRKDNTMYSDRSPSAVSTRTLLANALETTAQNDIEKNKLAQYKDKIDLIESEYAKLTEIRAKIKELSFAKGARDTKAIKDLQFQANQTANRINVYDRQLLNLESTTALKNVLQREKKLAYDKAKKEGKDALAKYKERAAKTQRELMNRNTESRKKAIEGRDKTDMRHKIRNIVDDLNKLLLNPTKDKHIPISLQKPVASALAVINMDTVGADERVAKHNELIAKAKDPDEIARLTKSRDNIELQGESLKDKLTVLQNAYAALLKSDDPLVKNAHDEAIENLIANTVDKVGDTSIRNMSLEQLEAVYDMFKAIKAKVRNTNKMFKEAKQETVTANSEWAKREISAVGGHRDLINKSTKWLKKFGWNMLKPIYAMKLIGSDVITNLYENVRKGEDTWAIDVNEAKDFFKETAKKYEYNAWDFEKPYKFTDSAGHSFSLTIEQIMSLYAYSKRKQADKHLELGGFIFDDSIEVTKKNKLGIPMKYEVNDANPYRLKKEDLAKVIIILDTDLKNVKGFVDEMQAYLSDVMGAKGNEVSLAMYDIKLYKEQNYFPLKSAKYFREFDPEKNGTPKIKNSGFSKNTVPQAGNPIVLSNFMDVWANHVNDMSMYHAFVLPLEDFMRVYNYSSTAGGYDSVQQYIKNAYGGQANSYIETLMNDLNGGARSDPATDLISKAMSLFKKAAVFASASVTIQQPSAIARAMAYIDAKYFVDKPEASKHSETWAEVKKYAPVAIIKEMGYFDTNMGRSTVDWIKEEKTWRDKIDDFASKAPALADELAWCAIWKAVKREIADSTNLQVGSKAFLEMAGKRFTEVVTKTQVYDSVLSRSALMRSKDSGAKMITAFMAEPTTSLNMVVDAIIEGKRGNKKFAGKAIGAVATSIILNSILVSLVTAARDDDDDETYTEKYLESLTAELLDGFNPLTYIPLVKDVWSIMQGYDIERSDMSIWSDLWESVENLFSDNKSGFEKTEGVVGSIASIFGLPLKNLMRDARAMYNLASTLLSGTPTTWAGVGEAVGGAVKSSIPLYSRIEKWAGADKSKSDKLYDAIISGDQAHIDRVKAQYSDEQAIESAMSKGLRENDSRIKEAAQARYDGDIEEYKRIAKEIIAEGYFSQDTVVAAINAEINAIKNGETTEEDQSADTTEKVTSIYTASDINDAFEGGDTDMALEVIDDLVKTKVANGMTEKEAKSSLRSSMTSYWKPLYKEAYKSKDTDEQERIKKILKDSGLYGNAGEVIETVRKWRTEKD